MKLETKMKLFIIGNSNLQGAEQRKLKFSEFRRTKA